MKILVFEFIAGGGLSREALPDSLVNEGMIMLSALVQDLMLIPEISLILPLDQRIRESPAIPQHKNIYKVVVSELENLEYFLLNLMQQCDAIWAIAPETDGVLADVWQWAVDSGKIVLGSTLAVTRLTANKYQTYQRLIENGIPTIVTRLATETTEPIEFPMVIKPIDGAGCEDTYLLHSQIELENTQQTFDTKQYILQPYIAGELISVSCLFKDHQAWVLSINHQQMLSKNNQFHLSACLVNSEPTDNPEIVYLVNQIAKAFTGLWGYIGIDMVCTNLGLVVMEINPRLTTSYAGIRSALGYNVAQNVLNLLTGEPNLRMTVNKTIKVSIPGDFVHDL